MLPLLKKRPEIVELCHRIKADLQRHTMAVYDDTAAIGKLYRRQDEIGTPWCVTVDVDSLEDGAVTVRDRDSMTQERVPVEGVTRLILDRLDAAAGRVAVAAGRTGPASAARSIARPWPRLARDARPAQRARSHLPVRHGRAIRLGTTRRDRARAWRSARWTPAQRAAAIAIVDDAR